MNKILLMNIGDTIEVKMSFANRKETIEYFSDYSNINDILEILVEECDDFQKPQQELDKDETEDETMVRQMVSTVSTECLHEFMHEIINELEKRCSTK